MRAGACVISALLLTGCVQLTTESLPSQAVDSSFKTSGLNWRSGAKMTLAYKVFELRGKVGFCGAYAEGGPGHFGGADLNQQALAAAQIRLAGETLLRGLDFFERGQYVAGKAPGGNASCVLTDRPWEARFKNTKPRVRWGKTSFRVVD